MGNSFFVDEAGDTTLFKRHGTVIIGQEGCSKYFFLGFLDVPETSTIDQDIISLREDLRNDSYLSGIPSMQPNYHKTYDFFHAKDDCPEVRREVFRLLKQHDEIRVHAIVKSKQMILDEVRQKSSKDVAYRYNPNEVYDGLTKRLFKNQLHKEDEYVVTFAERGNSDRTDALLKALKSAQHNFDKKWNTETTSSVKVICGRPQNFPKLQVVDYYLWALQRLYEKEEDRYFEYIKDSFSLIEDVSNTKNAAYGEYYTKKKPLTLTAVKDYYKGDIGTATN